MLAVAGLDRLGFGERITARLGADVCLPALGQGALGIECRRNDPALETLLARLHDAPTAACVVAERAVSHGLGGSCLSPIAGFAQLAGDHLDLAARVGAPDGSRLLATTATGTIDAAEAIGARAAAALMDQGALDLLAADGGGG